MLNQQKPNETYIAVLSCTHVNFFSGSFVQAYSLHKLYFVVVLIVYITTIYLCIFYLYIQYYFLLKVTEFLILYDFFHKYSHTCYRYTIEFNERKKKQHISSLTAHLQKFTETFSCYVNFISHNIFHRHKIKMLIQMYINCINAYNF